jgi:lysophospholipase L1-like esterase
MRHLPDWDFEFSINAHGFRDDPFLPRAPHTPTIAFLGDSYIFGYGVADDQTIPHQFEVLMQQQYGQSVTAWNCGVYGYTITDSLLSWKHQVEPLKPDIVIYMIYLGNDFEEFARDRRRLSIKHQQGKWHLQVEGTAPDYSAWRRAIEAVPPAARNVVVNNAQLWGLLRPVLSRYYGARQEEGSATGGRKSQDINDNEMISRYVRHVGYLEQFVAKPILVVVVPPSPGKFLAPNRQQRIHQMVQQLMASGLTVLDLRETLQPKRYYFQHDSHLTPLGNRVAALAIASYFTTDWMPTVPVNSNGVLTHPTEKLPLGYSECRSWVSSNSSQRLYAGKSLPDAAFRSAPGHTAA